MSHGYGTLGFIVIMILYIGIGVLAAIGCIFLFRKALSPKAEQICYGLLLIEIGRAHV